MAKIIVAFADEAQCERMVAALESAGIEVFRRCHTGAEAMRALNLCEDGVLVCSPLLRDRTADELAADAGEEALMLIVGRPELLALCETRRAFRLPLPASRGELTSAVRMLLQLHDMRKPRRGEEERAWIERAKAKLMAERGLSEPQAHRLLQRASMNLGIKMVEGARRILDGEELM